MKKCFFIFLLISLLYIPQSKAGVLEDIWDKYTANTPEQLLVKEVEKSSELQTYLGRVVGEFLPKPGLLFKEAWKYRSITYELHYENQQSLNAMIYGLALHAGDIDNSLPYDKFIKGVLGFHYSIEQICNWINDAWLGKTRKLSPQEYALVGVLLQDGIIFFAGQKFISTGLAKHILGASPGKKKSFKEVLEHERLHVFWDEDKEFRTKSRRAWNALSSEEKEKERKKLYRYTQDNEAQLIEEWAVHKKLQ